MDPISQLGMLRLGEESQGLAYGGQPGVRMQT